MIKLIVGVIALLAIGARACEPECRVGVAKAFSSHYSPVIQMAVTRLEETLVPSLHEVTLPQSLAAVVPQDAIGDGLADPIHEAILTFVDRVGGESLSSSIHSVMFEEQDPFKGDCNHPKRLTRKMPPAGQSWRMDECEKMDYICGNPPSICYFRELIRARIVQRIKDQLTEHATYDNGLLIRLLVEHVKRGVLNVLGQYGAGSMVDDPSTLELINRLVSKTTHTVDTWAHTYVDELCQPDDQQTTCRGWDAAIIPEILKWP